MGEAPPAPAPPAPPTGAPPTAPEPAALPWARVIAGAGTPRMRALLEQVRLVSLDEKSAVLAPAPEVRRILEQRLAEVSQLVSTVLGRPVACGLEGGRAPAPAPGPEPEPGESPVSVVMNHPLVQRAIEVFNARVVRVERAERTVRSDGE